jgi:hypothetical protein
LLAVVGIAVTVHLMLMVKDKPKRSV